MPVSRRAPLAGRTLAAALAASALVLACSGSDLTLPGEGTPAAITVVRGDAQTARVGQPLADSLAVRVTDGVGHAVAGALLRWQAAGGSVSPTTSRTDSTGYAAARRILGDSAGSYPTTVAVDGAAGVRATFSAVATAETPARLALALVTPPPASARAGEVLSRQPELQVRDGDGRDVKRGGLAVTAAIASGAGTLAGTTTRTTDAAGRARFTDLAITGASGDHTLIFAAAGVASVRSGTITVSAPTPPPPPPRTPARIAIRGGDGQQADVGTRVATAPSVLVSDADGAPVGGVAVTFAVTGGKGSVTGAKQTTGSDGVATVGSWTLGAEPGTNTLAATAAGVDAGVTFTATGRAVAPVAAGLAFATQPSDAKRKEPITPPVQVKVVDRDGKLVPVDGLRVTLELRGDDEAHLSGTTTQATVAGVATFTVAVDETGDYTLRATAAGLGSVDSRTFRVRR